MTCIAYQDDVPIHFALSRKLSILHRFMKNTNELTTK